LCAPAGAVPMMRRMGRTGYSAAEAGRAARASRSARRAVLRPSLITRHSSLRFKLRSLRDFRQALQLQLVGLGPDRRGIALGVVAVAHEVVANLRYLQRLVYGLLQSVDDRRRRLRRREH